MSGRGGALTAFGESLLFEGIPAILRDEILALVREPLDALVLD